MKKIYPFLLLFISATVFAQIPTYYNDVNINLTGSSLKNALATKIISTHATNLSYTPGVWNALKQTDLDPNNNSKVLLIYGYNDTDGNHVTDRTRGKDDNGGNAGSEWNREHVYPKSLGNPNLGTSGPGADVHHLRPADISFNSQRGSQKFAQGSGNAGSVSGGWYPGDEWKGDVARMMLYMYLRYGNQCLPKNVAVGSSPSSDNNMVSMLLEWNAQDPVSNLEKQRNPIVESLQGNRNPFIDNPAFATKIWGGPQAEDLFGTGSGDTQAPTAPSSLTVSNTTATSVNLTWNASSDNVGVTAYDVYRNNTKITTVSNTNYQVNGLTPATNYSFYIKAKDAANNISTASNTVSVTTSSGSSTGTATDLLISEYIEGSSNNKAIELANFTGNAINLSNYSLKKATNGGGWSNTLALNGQLTNGKTYVIAHTSASSTVKNKAQKTDSGVLSFNGNDAIGLFKNNVLIDLIGNPNSSNTFAKDKTLQRKSTVNSPNITYVTSEWITLSKDTFSDLGNHTIDGGSTPDTSAPTTPSNLTISNITQTSMQLNWNASSDNIAVTGYDVYRNSVKVATSTSTNFSVTGLNASTNYNFYIKAKDAAGNSSSASTVKSATTLANNLNYCSSKGDNANFEFIDNIVLGGISNSTNSNGGYADFTSLTGILPYGNNTIVVSAGFSGSSYTENWRVWIDFNQNGTFDSNELVVNGSSSSAGNLSYNFNIPSTAKSGKTRMRVSMKWNGTPSPCETFSYGEVEDYSVIIGASNKLDSKNIKTVKIDGKLGNEPASFDANIYPNPTKDFVSLQLIDGRTSSFEIYNSIGQVVSKGKTSRVINLSSLAKGIYIININDGNKTITKKLIKE